MFYFDKARGVRVTSNQLSDLRRKAILYLRTVKVINVVDIWSTQQGYMGNIYKSDSSVFIWSPAKGKRLEYPDTTYLGNPQSYLDNEGNITDKTGSVIAPFNVYRR